MAIKHSLIIFAVFLGEACSQSEIPAWDRSPVDLIHSTDQLFSHYCNGSENGWDDFSLHLGNVQSCAIYNDKLFIIGHKVISSAPYQEQSDVDVFDLATGSLLCTTTRPINNGDHANSAGFIPMFLDPNDDYPLLMVSEMTGGKVHFYHITQSGGDFTFALHKTITFENFGGSGNTVAYDYQRNIFVNWYNENDNYAVTTDNDVVFELYNAVDLMSPSDYIYQSFEVKSSFRLPFFIVQAGYYSNGRLFAVVQCAGDGVNGSIIWKKFGIMVRNNVFVINIHDAIVDSFIPIELGMEPEGIAIHNGAMYIPMRNNTGVIKSGYLYFCVIKIYDFNV